MSDHVAASIAKSGDAEPAALAAMCPGMPACAATWALVHCEAMQLRKWWGARTQRSLLELLAGLNGDRLRAQLACDLRNGTWVYHSAAQLLADTVKLAGTLKAIERSPTQVALTELRPQVLHQAFCATALSSAGPAKHTARGEAQVATAPGQAALAPCQAAMALGQVAATTPGQAEAQALGAAMAPRDRVLQELLAKQAWAVSKLGMAAAYSVLASAIRLLGRRTVADTGHSEEVTALAALCWAVSTSGWVDVDRAASWQDAVANNSCWPQVQLVLQAIMRETGADPDSDSNDNDKASDIGLP